MIIDILKNAEATWREIAKLANPLDSEKPVVIDSNPKSPSDFEAYTDNKNIYIKINNEKKFKKNFEDIIVPAYNIAATRLYDVKNTVSDKELLANLVFDTFLFIHFHEQLHPWLCPNSKADEKTINKALYDGIHKAEPGLSKAEILYKVNNCKNLVWDTVLNISFVSKTAGYNQDNLEQKIKYVFAKNKRQIEYQPVAHYPSGILPIVYMTSAQNRTTDIPISLVGAVYATMSYNDAGVRQKAIEIFLDDLKSKKMQNPDALDVLQKMYAGFVSEIHGSDLLEIGIDKADYKKRIAMTADFANPLYEDNQKYFVAALTKIFDSPSMRYDSLKGFIQPLSKHISLSQKQGSPDQNTMGQGSSSEDDESSASGSGGSGGGSGESDEKSQDEMDENSMGQTLDDLLGTLDEKDADDLLGEVANGDVAGGGRGKGGPSSKIRKKMAIIAADEYYKKNADVIEVHNPSEENVSYDLGSRKVWKLVRSQNVAAVEVAKMNHKQILAFQKATGLPVLMEQGNGYYRLNEYKQHETPLKSYSAQKTGIETPDNWVLFQDSSGSMAQPNYVGTKCRFDLLNLVKYGVMKGLYKVCKELGKDMMFGVVDFADATIYSGLDKIVKIYEAKTHPIKEVSLTPQCGGTSINSTVFSKIKKDLAPGKTIYTFITDGEIDGDTTSLFTAIDKFSADPNNAFVFVEIDSHSNFGQQVQNLSKTRSSILYYSVKDVKSIKDKLSSVLIKYG